MFTIRADCKLFLLHTNSFYGRTVKGYLRTTDVEVMHLEF